ncbi:uncharacterized protein LOC109947437 [Prunus persica]|uniref:uncharacterized protein LOC109947437 n=1 Tax=Prunus persica TaxID=3760 RepID=UPI0009AB6780|nr:uncharacterized protein LOC109947437 [Prunus persica]
MISFSRAAAEGDLSLPVGFRFRPTDEELVNYYLKNKVQGTDLHAEGIIDEIDILKFEPWDLVELVFQLNYMQRDLVLCHCHLKKNVKKSDEIHTDVATTCDEGEPSTHNASDFEHPPAHDILEEDTQQPENLDYFERKKDLLIASSCSNNDHNATFADNDLEPELEESLRTLNTKPFHAGELSLEKLYELQRDSSQSIQDTDIMLHNQLSRQAASSVNLAPKPQTDRVQFQSGTYQREHRPQQQSGPIIVFRDTSADEYYTREKTRRITYPPEKPKEPEKPKPEPEKPKEPEERRTSVDLPQKQISITKSSIDKKVPQGSMEQTENRTTPGNWKRSFITWQTSPLKSPPSVYIFNTVLGTILFLFCVREVVLYGKWS